MSPFRKILGAAGVALVTGLLSTLPTQAQEPMRIVIPVPVGAGADNVARVIALRRPQSSCSPRLTTSTTPTTRPWRAGRPPT